MSFAAVMGGVGLASQLYSILNPPQTPEAQQMNPLTDQYIQQLQSMLPNAQNQMNAYAGKVNGYQNQMSASASEAGRLANAAENVQAPDTNQWFQNFMKQVPGYEDVALNFAEKASLDQGRTIDEQVQAAQTQAIDQVSSQFAGNNPYSGAAAGAATQAALTPALEAQASMQGNRAAQAGQTFNTLAGQGQGLTYQATQDQFTNALQVLQQALSGVGTQAGIQGNQAQTAQGMASMYGNQANNINSMLGQMASPVYQQEQAVDTMGQLGNLAMAGASYANMFAPKGVAPDIDSDGVGTKSGLQYTLNPYSKMNTPSYPFSGMGYSYNPNK